MADPATQFQSAGLNVPYQYTPVETRLNPPIHLDPVNYDAIQKAVSAIPGLLMSSPLNPAVRNQMQAEAARYQLEKDVISDVAKAPDRARRVGVTSQGAEIVPGYQVGNIPQPDNSGGVKPRDTSGGNGGANGDTNGAVTNQQNVDANGNPVPTKLGFAAPAPATAYARPGETGGIQQKAAPPSPYQVPKTIQRPPEAPADNQQQGIQPSTSQGIVQNQPPIYQPGQQQLTAWQDQNAHPVMSAQDALAWAKRYNTAIKHAVYMPNGGPLGQPAFAFSDGKSNNLVPLSQIVQNGGGPLVAGQNTSQVLSATNQQQGQQPQQPQPQQIQQPQQPQGPQLAQNQAPAAPVTANTPLSPEEKAYIASQTGDVSVLAADTTNHFLLQANAERNKAMGNTAIAPNTIRDNASNVPRSTNPLQNDPVPQGEQKGKADEQINAELERVKATPAGLNGLPDGPDGNGQKKLGGITPQGFQWFVDTNPDPKNGPDSHWPYLVVQTSPWSERRFYNPVGNEWIPVEVTRPDRILDQQIMEKTGQDSRDWPTERKVVALRDDYNLHNTLPMSNEVQAKLEALRAQVLQSQRLLEGTKHMTDGDWGFFRQIQNQVADNANIAGGTFADAWVREMAKKIAPGGIDPRLMHLSDSFAALMKGREDPNLSPQERGELNNITMGTSLPDRIQKLNHSRMIEFNRYYNQAVANKYRISNDYMETADQITNNHRILDGGLPDWSTLPNPRVTPTAPPAPTPTPTPIATPTPAAAQATPTPLPVPASNSQTNPMDMNNYPRDEAIRRARQLPSGTWVNSRGRIFQVP